MTIIHYHYEKESQHDIMKYFLLVCFDRRPDKPGRCGPSQQRLGRENHHECIEVLSTVRLCESRKTLNYTLRYMNVTH